MQLITLTAIRSTVKDGFYKGMKETKFYKDNHLFATMPASQRQPKYGSKTITLNCWKWNLEWATTD